MPDVDDLLGLAAAHLATAAHLADHRDGTRDGAWAAFAGQIRLTAAGLPAVAPDTPAIPAAPGTVHGHLSAALDAMDHIDPLDGPADLQLWAWHIAELARLAQTTDRP